MPHKFNSSRRHKFDAKRYKVTNWPEYNESLRQRGNVMVWLRQDVVQTWRADQRDTPGGQPIYSDIAICVCLTLRQVYHQPLRQTQGLMRGLLGIMGIDVSIPDYSTLSRRGSRVKFPEPSKLHRSSPIHLVVDSTGLKIFGEGEWLHNKHNVQPKRKSWRKLHLGLDLNTGEIVCTDLTKDDVGDPTALPELLDQIETPVRRFLGDGAYDGDPTSDLLMARFGKNVQIIIPPPIPAVVSPKAARDPTPRNTHITEIAQRGRMDWQVSSGYNQRSRIEAQIGRWKMVSGPQMRARKFENQKTEAKIGTHILNKMNELGRAKCELIA